MPSLGERLGKFVSRDEVVGIVVHTTGGGVLARWKRERSRFPANTPTDTAVRLYTQIMTASPHYVVGQEGRLVQVCCERLAAWHVGSNRSQAYGNQTWLRKWFQKQYPWWAERFPGLSGPQDLASGQLWSGPGCNPVTIGIEVVPPLSGATKPWGDDCWASLLALICDIAERHSIPLDQGYHIVSHSEAHPRSRTKNGKPWDPSDSQWTQKAFRQRLADFQAQPL